MLKSKIIFIIAAGGQGKRIQSYLNGEKKQFFLINNKPVIEYVIDRIYSFIPVDECFIAVPETDDMPDYKQYKEKYPFIKFVKGGKQRQDSVYNALKAVISNDGIALVHDAVRPFFSKSVLYDLINKAETDYAAVPGVKAKDTIRLEREGSKTEVFDRNRVWHIQTPQAFKLKILKDAYEKAKEDKFYGTDDACIVERLGYKISIVKGEYRNFKITEPFDMEVAEKLIG